MWIPLEISTRDSAVPVLKLWEWLQCAVCEWDSERLYTPTVWHQVTATCTRSSLHGYVIYLFSWNVSTMLCVAHLCFTRFYFVLSLSWAAAFVIMQSSLSAYLECWQHFRLDFTHTSSCDSSNVTGSFDVFYCTNGVPIHSKNYQQSTSIGSVTSLCPANNPHWALKAFACSSQGSWTQTAWDTQLAIKHPSISAI